MQQSHKLSKGSSPSSMEIQTELHKFPFCIVWTIIPCITWLIPVIGHTGICDNKGTIYDFLGYHINVGEMAFGRPRKYVKLKISENLMQSYVSAVKSANTQFCQRGHDLCCNNCHHHVAHALNVLRYKGRQNWGQVSIWWLCIKESHYVDWCSVFAVYAPFAIIVIAIILAITLS